MTFVTNIPPTIINLVQQGLLEREFHDGLYPANLFRDEAEFEPWEQGTGTEMYQSKPGLIAPSLTPLTPGQDPTPKVVNYEQWRMVLERYGDTIDTNTQTSAVALQSLFLRNIKQLGLNAGQVLNRVPRNRMYKDYLAGHTCLVDACGAGDTQIHLSQLNGFSDLIRVGTDVRPTAVSAAVPLPVTIGVGAAAVVRNVIMVQPDNANDPDGPGWVLLSAAVGGAGFAARTPVVSAYASVVLRVGGGASIDAIGAADTFVMQNAIVAASILKNNNVPPHDDGLYHCHIGPLVSAQAFNDTAFQRVFTGLPNSEEIKRGVLGTIGNVKFIQNTECPQRASQNTGTLTATGTNAMYASDIGSEITNEGGVDIGHSLVTGKGMLYERGFDEKAYVTEAGVTGKITNFNITNNGVSVVTNRIQLIIRAPLNRTQDQVASTWTCSTGFACPSDACSGGAARFKRGIVIQSAL